MEIGALRKDVDRVACDCYDIRKHVEATEARNVDLGAQIRSLDINIKEKEDNLYACRKDIENQAYTNSNLRQDLSDLTVEKDAIERHSRILLGQNDDLTKELERFVNTDEVLRQQLDRRGRVYTMQERNNQELGMSTTKIYEARQRSPLRESRYSPYAGRDQSPPAYRATGKTYGVSTATGGTRGSPLRSSYKPSYKQ